MIKISKDHSKVFFYTFLLLHATTPLLSQEVEDEREFDYDPRSNRGPGHWGEIKREWAACNRGEMQSPIDMSNQRVDLIKRFGGLVRSYNASNATLFNRGHDITLKWRGDAGHIEINGTRYFLRQCHWHVPSEHTINGRRYDMEMHMVHSSGDTKESSKIAVIGQLYRTGRPDAFLSMLSRGIRSMVGTVEGMEAGIVDPRRVRLRVKRHYRYLGSLTVPPCTEGVRWILNQQIATVSRTQLSLLRDAVQDFARSNARPVQPLNRRRVHLYRPRTDPGSQE